MGIHLSTNELENPSKCFEKLSNFYFMMIDILSNRIMQKNPEIWYE